MFRFEGATHKIACRVPLSRDPSVDGVALRDQVILPNLILLDQSISAHHLQCADIKAVAPTFVTMLFDFSDASLKFVSIWGQDMAWNLESSSRPSS